MFWLPLAMAGMSLLQTKKQNDQIKATNITNASNTRIANIEQNANSTISAAQGALSRVTQSLQTQEAQRQYGLQLNSLEKQRVDLSEQMAKGSFANRVNAAAKQGALQAQASAAGVGGSTIDMLGQSMALQTDMAQRDMDSAYSDNLFALEQDEQENLYGQYGIIQQQNVYLDNVAAAQVLGPAKVPKISTGSALLQAGLSAAGAYASVGGTSESFFGSVSSGANKLKSWFSTGAKSGG